MQSLKSGKDVKAVCVTNRRTMGQEDMIQEQPTEAATPAAVHEAPEATDGSKGSSERIFCLTGSKNDFGKRINCSSLGRNNDVRTMEVVILHVISFPGDRKLLISQPRTLTVETRPSRGNGVRRQGEYDSVFTALDGEGGPNVCGTRCCYSWLVNPKTKQCTKPRCHPRCHNKAVCRRPNICQCRPGFHGHRCEHVNINPTLSTWFETQPGPILHSTAAVATVTMATPVSTTIQPNISTSASNPDARMTYSLRWQPPSFKEAQSVLLKRVLSNGTGGEKITSVILKYIESERSRLESSSSTGATKLSSTKTFHTQRGQYTLVYTAEHAGMVLWGSGWEVWGG
ncbi:Latent-transforming growth factor beta-binding protein 1 [Anabarilius grahami]|uniref:Latent-transforming growth factor beta-binding protein 1 n=1 Tax=Anabarilius grahami TaxID=495550 RepID=A0A3N0Z315_ANAGA|nr:Latent-transforming growth factor beta-binding protein 1 [Anabarilius grahami]